MRFLLIIGSPYSLAKKHLMDVGVLSYRIMSQSVSASLQDDICFIHPPKPAPLSARLAARFPVPDNSESGGIRDFHVPHKYHDKQLRFCPSTGGATSTKKDVRTFSLDHLPFGQSLTASLASC